MAVQLFRVLAFALLLIAIVLHVVGFATHFWVVAKLDPRGVPGIMSANAMSSGDNDAAGMDINLGLWKYCLKVNLQWGPQQGAADSSNMPSGPDGQSMDPQTGDSPIPNQPNGHGDPFNSEENIAEDYSHSALAPEMAWKTEQCQNLNSASTPDWMKGVQALGILSLLAAGVGATLTIYSHIGDSKGDRARLMPFIIGAVVLAAGVLQVIAVIVYGTEFSKVMTDQMSMMGTNSPEFHDLADNVKKNTSMGFSFVLETVAGCLMVLSSLVIVFAGLRDKENAGHSRGMNMAI